MKWICRAGQAACCRGAGLSREPSFRARFTYRGGEAPARYHRWGRLVRGSQRLTLPSYCRRQLPGALSREIFYASFAWRCLSVGSCITWPPHVGCKVDDAAYCATAVERWPTANRVSASGERNASRIWSFANATIRLRGAGHYARGHSPAGTQAAHCSPDIHLAPSVNESASGGAGSACRTEGLSAPCA